MKSWDEIRKDMIVYIKDPIEVYEDDIVIGKTKPFQEAYVYNCDDDCATLIIEGGEFDGYDFYWYFKEDKPEEILIEKEFKAMTKNLKETIQGDKQALFERFLNASFELKTELMNKLFKDGTYLTDKEQEFTLALSEWHKSI